MVAEPIDLRSDTLTRPTPEMRAAIAAAEVGDDVFGEDPTIERLESRIAEMLGMEAALYMPSGTMSNQAAVRLHCQPGDEFLCEASCHLYNNEQAAFAQLFGISVQPIPGNGGLLRIEHVVDQIRPANDHCVRTRLVCLENTHNRGGGRILPYDDVVEICAWAVAHGLARHLDGARLFNAVVASGIPAADWAQHFDTVSVCFSKGLGAPVGSALCGRRDLIRQARRVRKVLGGGMRQAGIIAAGALFALEHHVERLAEDHHKAHLLAQSISTLPSLHLDPPVVDTNMVCFTVPPELGTAATFCERLQCQGVLMLAVGSHRIRAVTHLDVSVLQIEEACQILSNVCGSQPAPLTAKTGN